MNNTITTDPYADQLARVANPILINRMKGAGLNRANRRSLSHKARRGTLRGSDFPAWLINILRAAS